MLELITPLVACLYLAGLPLAGALVLTLREDRPKADLNAVGATLICVFWPLLGVFTLLMLLIPRAND